MSSSLRPSAPCEQQRLEHAGVQTTVGRRHVGERGVGDRLVAELEAQRTGPAST